MAQPPIVRRVKSVPTTPNKLSFSDLTLMTEIGITDTNKPRWTVQLGRMCVPLSNMAHTPEIAKGIFESLSCKVGGTS